MVRKNKTSTIVVEQSGQGGENRRLDCIASAVKALGHTVRRVRINREKDTLQDYGDITVIWHGLQYNQPAIIKKYADKTKFLFVEWGWLPQEATFQLDPKGINSAASWSPIKPVVERKSPFRRDIKGGKLLVPLQKENDSSIVCFSPQFKSMLDFIEALLDEQPYNLIVRPHPRDKNLKHAGRNKTQKFLDSNNRIEVDESPDIFSALMRQDVMAMATINSTSALHALSLAVPVLCYGNSFYSDGSGLAVSDMTNPDMKAEVINRLANNKAPTVREAELDILRQVYSLQWREDHLPGRLATMLERILS